MSWGALAREGLQLALRALGALLPREREQLGPEQRKGWTHAETEHVRRQIDAATSHGVVQGQPVTKGDDNGKIRK